MNNRIQELAEQAWRAASDEVAHLNRVHNRSYSQDEITDIFEIKFAELLIEECVEICLVHRVRNNDYNQGRTECASDIKEHFGAE